MPMAADRRQIGARWRTKLRIDGVLAGPTIGQIGRQTGRHAVREGSAGDARRRGGGEGLQRLSTAVNRRQKSFIKVDLR
jgi:hypothetical protein